MNYFHLCIPQFYCSSNYRSIFRIGLPIPMYHRFYARASSAVVFSSSAGFMDLVQKFCVKVWCKNKLLECYQERSGVVCFCLAIQVYLQIYEARVTDATRF